MNAAQNRFKQLRAPSGGSEDTKCRSVGASSAAPGRPKQARAPSGGSADTKCRSVGAA